MIRINEFSHAITDSSKLPTHTLTLIETMLTSCNVTYLQAVW